MNKQSIIISAVAVVAIGVGLYFFFNWHATPEPVATALKPAVTAPAITNPVPIPAAPQVLPPLDSSDTFIQSELNNFLGQPFVQAYLLPQTLVRRMVVTVDNLPRKKLATTMNPVVPMAGQVGDATAVTVTLGPADFARYDAFVQSVTAVDSKQLAATYFRLYPLFQEAYHSLGYPNGYFNDRLVTVIDHLIATPYLSQPIELTNGPGVYQFADPKLEALSAGQKIMIRIGPDNSAKVRSKLKEIRALLASAPPGASSAP